MVGHSSAGCATPQYASAPGPSGYVIGWGWCGLFIVIKGVRSIQEREEFIPQPRRVAESSEHKD